MTFELWRWRRKGGGMDNAEVQPHQVGGKEEEKSMRHLLRLGLREGHN